LRGRDALAPCRRGLWRVGPAVAGPSTAARRDRARRQRRLGRPQMAVPNLWLRHAAGPRPRPARAELRAQLRLSARRRGRGRGAELLGHRAGTHPARPGDPAVADPAGGRTGRHGGRDRARFRSRRSRRARGPRDGRMGGRRARPDGDRHVSLRARGAVSRGRGR
ncbi:MAG: hypothetical protein M1823_008810, partial [Watsoniomyces obsoletus]